MFYAWFYACHKRSNLFKQSKGANIRTFTAKTNTIGMADATLRLTLLLLLLLSVVSMNPQLTTYQIFHSYGK